MRKPEKVMLMTRKVDDGERIKAAIRNADGKRLKYYQPILNL
jgi:hypothetical protein